MDTWTAVSYHQKKGKDYSVLCNGSVYVLGKMASAGDGFFHVTKYYKKLENLKKVMRKEGFEV